jgi:hypothetical protein
MFFVQGQQNDIHTSQQYFANYDIQEMNNAIWKSKRNSSQYSGEKNE